MIDVVIDLSDNNNKDTSTPIDFAAIAQAGILGVLHKATEGITYHDKHYVERRPQALAANLLWGAYHFGRDEDATKQVDNFWSVVQANPTDLMVLDFEVMGGMTTAQAEAFVEAINQKTGRYPGLYTTVGYLEQQGAINSSILHNCWLWLAEFTDAPEPRFPAGWPNVWTMWQYTQTATVTGVEGACDRDQFNGPVENLYKLWGAPMPAPSA